MTVSEAVNKLIEVAESQIGYLEKKSNSKLDDKTANAGSGNYTKYNRDMRAWAQSAGINDQWCQNFVDWCFVTAFGLTDAKRLIYTFTNYTPTGSNAFKKHGRYIKRGQGTPKRGDVIYFYSSSKGRIGHVGIVYKVSGKTVYTIEGNTSGASSLVTNGGGVRKKSYSMSSSYIDGYGSVDYNAVFGGGEQPEDGYKLGERTLQKGDVGPDVKELQQDLVTLGWSFPKYGCDGDFGEETEINVKGFQRISGLEPDGIFGPATYQALVAALHQTVTITGDAVNVRKGPGLDYAILGTARKGDKLPYGGQQREDSARVWYLVDYHNENGWVSSKYAILG